MKYALGNMLNGAGGLNSDGLALDLQFAADKTLTARKGPSPILTRGSTGTFVGSNGLIQSAGTDIPRFDHYPVSPFACRGLLIEEGRTNSITGSNAFNTWTTGNCTVSASSVVTPEGTADAWKIVEDSITATHSITRPFTPVSGTTYTASAWIKSAENGFAFVGLTGGGFASTFISVNLSTGAVSTATGTPIGATSVAHSNGWWRVSFSLAATASLSSVVDIRLSRDGIWANRSYLGNGVNGMYVYGAQVEAGSFPTSYIPTTTSTLARAADTCSITGGAFNSFYNQSEGSLFSDLSSASGILARAVTAIGSTAAEQVAIGLDVTRVRAGSVDIGSFYVNAPILGKRVVAYASGQQAASRLGGVVSSTNAGLPSGISSLFIGGTTNFTSTVTIAAIRYFKKRLPNAKLASLTV